MEKQNSFKAIWCI